jgi:hypothetical protein
MHVTAQGEHIARKTSCPNAQERTGAKTLRGSSRPRLDSPPLVDKTRREPIETLRRRPVFPLRERPEKARERRSGEVPVQGPRKKTLEGQNPREHPATRCAKHTPDRKGLSEGSKPRSRGFPGRVVTLVTAIPAGEMACGSVRTETFGHLSRGKSSEG